MLNNWIVFVHNFKSNININFIKNSLINNQSKLKEYDNYILNN